MWSRAASALMLEGAFVRFHGWLIRPPHRPKMLLLVMLSSIWAVMTITAGVWVWALTYDLLGVFPTFEESLYFSIVTYTTLGYGDVFGALEAASQTLGRTINPALYTVADFKARQLGDNAFINRVMQQPKIWLIGQEESPKHEPTHPT
jgi:hypothetical protein